MSRQQTFAPDEPERTRSKAVKAKPWCAWHKWRHGWWRSGRYRTRQEAEKAMADQVRKYHHRKYHRLGGWAERDFRVRHESEGKPT